MEHILEVGCDVCLVQETFLTDKDTAKIMEIRDYGMEIISNPRKYRSGGGIAVIYRKSLDMKCSRNLITRKSFQVMETTVCTNVGMIRLVNIYRPPYSKMARFTEAHFLKEFEEYLECLDEKDGRKIIVGDFNIHMEKTEDTYTRQFSNLLRRYSLKQMVPIVPTHNRGGTLDLIIIDEDLEDVVGETKVVDTGTDSDHSLVLCDFKIKTTASRTVGGNIIEYRNFKNIDLETFKKDILDSGINGDFTSLEEAVETYNNELTALMDKHCPVIRRKIREKPTPWLDEELRELRKKRRAAERKFRKPASTAADKEEYVRLRKSFDSLSLLKKKLYHQTSLKKSSGDMKSLYKKVHKLLGNENTELPEHDDSTRLAESFKDYFTSKVGKIRSGIEEELKKQHRSTQISEDNDDTLQKTKDPKDKDTSSDFDVLDEFKELSSDELKQMVSELSNKFCCLDPIPTFLLKSCIEELTPIILYIVNESLKTGVFPGTMKTAVVKPTLKKTNADPDTLSNYRPVSNLSTMSKLLERVVLQQLNSHLEDNELFCSAQSGYRKNHSCETLLIRMSDDLLKRVNGDQTVMIILLDLSAAFDTIDHEILVQKLHEDYMISGTPLQWVISYLRGRSFSVKINGCMSTLEDLLYGVPQGSILGPILFILYTKELQAIAAKYGLEIQLYADDSQVYTGFNSKRPASLEDTMRRIKGCMAEIKDWMVTNFMKLNTGKTELLVCAKRRVMDTIDEVLMVQVGEDEIAGCNWKGDSGKSLGVKFDESLKMERQIADVVKRCNWTLLNLRRIASFLSEELKIMLVKQLVLSKIDYCNALYMNLPATRVKRLKSVMNSAIRFIYHIRDRGIELTPYYKKAHIMPFEERVHFKACLMVHKAFYDKAPGYIRELITIETPNHMTRLKDGGKRLVPQMAKTNLESRMFSNYGPDVWNNLPSNIRNQESTDAFKSLLKTHLFPS